MDIITSTALLFLAGSLGLLFVALSLPVLERIVRLTDQTREVIKTASLDFLQVKLSASQQGIDLATNQHNLEYQIEMDDIKLKAFSEAERLKPVLLSLRVTEALQANHKPLKSK